MTDGGRTSLDSKSEPHLCMKIPNSGGSVVKWRAGSSTTVASCNCSLRSYARSRARRSFWGPNVSKDHWFWHIVIIISNCNCCCIKICWCKVSCVFSTCWSMFCSCAVKCVTMLISVAASWQSTWIWRSGPLMVTRPLEAAVCVIWRTMLIGIVPGAGGIYEGDPPSLGKPPIHGEGGIAVVQRTSRNFKWKCMISMRKWKQETSKRKHGGSKSGEHENNDKYLKPCWRNTLRLPPTLSSGKTENAEIMWDAKFRISLHYHQSDYAMTISTLWTSSQFWSTKSNQLGLAQ